MTSKDTSKSEASAQVVPQERDRKGAINVGIVGGAGYTGGELIRILIHHPVLTCSFIHSRSKPEIFLIGSPD